MNQEASLDDEKIESIVKVCRKIIAIEDAEALSPLDRSLIQEFQQEKKYLYQLLKDIVG